MTPQPWLVEHVLAGYRRSIPHATDGGMVFDVAAQLLAQGLLPTNATDAILNEGLGIVGADRGVDLLWQWNKVSDVPHFPEAYVRALARATYVVIVRSADTGDDCPMLGRADHVQVNALLPHLNARLSEPLRAVLLHGESSVDYVRQQEWGLPDATVAAAKALWKHLGKPAEHCHVIEAETVELYERFPVLWQAYLQASWVAIRSVTFKAYWMAHPYSERFTGLSRSTYAASARWRRLPRSYSARTALATVRMAGCAPSSITLAAIRTAKTSSG